MAQGPPVGGAPSWKVVATKLRNMIQNAMERLLRAILRDGLILVPRTPVVGDIGVGNGVEEHLEDSGSCFNGFIYQMLDDVPSGTVPPDQRNTIQMTKANWNMDEQAGNFIWENSALNIQLSWWMDFDNRYEFSNGGVLTRVYHAGYQCGPITSGVVVGVAARNAIEAEGELPGTMWMVCAVMSGSQTIIINKIEIYWGALTPVEDCKLYTRGSWLRVGTYASQYGRHTAVLFDEKALKCVFIDTARNIVELDVSATSVTLRKLHYPSLSNLNPVPPVHPTIDYTYETKNTAQADSGEQVCAVCFNWPDYTYSVRSFVNTSTATWRGESTRTINDWPEEDKADFGFIAADYRTVISGEQKDSVLVFAKCVLKKGDDIGDTFYEYSSQSSGTAAVDYSDNTYETAWSASVEEESSNDYWEGDFYIQLDFESEIDGLENPIKLPLEIVYFHERILTRSSGSTNGSAAGDTNEGIFYPVYMDADRNGSYHRTREANKPGFWDLRSDDLSYIDYTFDSEISGDQQVFHVKAELLVWVDGVKQPPIQLIDHDYDSASVAGSQTETNLNLAVWPLEGCSRYDPETEFPPDISDNECETYVRVATDERLKNPVGETTQQSPSTYLPYDYWYGYDWSVWRGTRIPALNSKMIAGLVEQYLPDGAGWFELSDTSTYVYNRVKGDDAYPLPGTGSPHYILAVATRQAYRESY